MVLLRYLAAQPVPEVPIALKAPADGRALRATICSGVTWLNLVSRHAFDYLSVDPASSEGIIWRWTTIATAQGVLTPTLTGAHQQPSSWTAKPIRPLERESAKALTLLQSLDEKQRRQAVFPYAVADLVLGPGQDDKKIAPQSLKAPEANATRRVILLDLIAEWAGIIRQNPANSRMALMKAELNETWFREAARGPAQLEAMALHTIAFRVRTSSLHTHRRTTSHQPRAYDQSRSDQ